MSEYKFGFNGDVGTTEETIWDVGGLYSYLAAATQLKVSSSDANDDAAGTGARTVQLYGLDGSYEPIDELVTLDGQTVVTTSASFLRIFRIVVRSAGSGLKNAGVIYAGTGTVTDGVPENKYAAISAGMNQTLMCAWTVRNGYRAYLKNIIVSSQGNANQYATVRLVARPPGEVFQTKEKFIVYRSLIVIPHEDISSEFAEHTDLEIRGAADGGTVDVSAAMSIALKTG